MLKIWVDYNLAVDEIEIIIRDDYQIILQTIPQTIPLNKKVLNSILLEGINEVAQLKGSVNPYTGKVTN
jgi:hypothetical protein